MPDIGVATHTSESTGYHTARAWSNGVGYTVLCVRGNWKLLREVHWMNSHYGVIVGEYEVTRDDDASWHASIDVEANADGSLRMTGATITGDHLSTNAKIPVKPILNACLRVGGVYKP